MQRKPLFILICLMIVCTFIMSGCGSVKEATADVSEFKVYPCTEIVFLAGKDIPETMKSVSEIPAITDLTKACNTATADITFKTEDTSVTYFYPAFIRTGGNVSDIKISSVTPNTYEEGSAANDQKLDSASIILSDPGEYNVVVNITTGKTTQELSFKITVTQNATEADTSESLFDSLSMYQALLDGWEFFKNDYETVNEYAKTIDYKDTILPNIIVNSNSVELNEVLKTAISTAKDNISAGWGLYEDSKDFREKSGISRILNWQEKEDLTDEQIEKILSGDFSSLDNLIKA